MELWQVYKFTRFAKVQINGGNSGYMEIQRAYNELMNPAKGHSADDLWSKVVEEGYLHADGLVVRLTHKGSKLTEMHGYGFISTAIREYGGPVVLLAGIASIINLIIILINGIN